MAAVAYSLVDKREQVPGALAQLRRKEIVGVDCEGLSLSRFGKLCLLQIATGSTVYLFDIKLLGRDVFDMGEFTVQDHSV